jgi:transcriptional regulator
MYIPSHFEQPNTKVMHELIRTRPLATLVTFSANEINANHIPMHLSESPVPFGTLRGHVVRSNPIWRDLESNIEVLAIFHGPDAYISPSWYATKQETGKVVPHGITRSLMPTVLYASLMMLIEFVPSLKL